MSNQFPEFTPEQEKFIHENWDKMSYREVGEQIGRTTSSISHYCWRRGLTKRAFESFAPWEEEVIKEKGLVVIQLD